MERASRTDRKEVLMRRNPVPRVLVAAFPCAAVLAIALGLAAKDGPSTDTPAESIATYESLADAILSVKRTEANLVTSILASTLAHAKGSYEHALYAIKSGDEALARASTENLATFVGQLGTEGDAAVARVRKRLVEGGHHHNAAGEAKGIYDEGYVIVTRAAKKRLLDAAQAIGLLQNSPKADALEREWKNVESAWNDLMKERK
jgi:hypothetical protein